MMKNCAFSSPAGEMENEVSHLERVSQRAQEQQRQAWEARVEQARRQAKPNQPAGDHTYYDDLAQLRRAEAKRGSYTKRPRPASLPDLRGCDGDVLRVLSQLADQGKSAISKSEIGRRIGKHPETVRLSLRRLESAGMLRTAQRQGVAIRQDNGRVIRIDPPNHFTITDKGWMTLNRRPPAAARSAAVSTKKFRHPSESKNITTCTEERSAAKAAHTTAARSAPTGAARPIEPKPATTAPSRTARLHSGNAGGTFGAKKPDQPSGSTAQRPRNRREPASAEALARAAAQKLIGSEIEFTAKDDPFEILDRVRRQHLSRFDGGAWSRAVAAHGRETALLAAAVAMLRREDGRGRPITSRASYLGAMLRQSPAALNPAPSLHLLV